METGTKTMKKLSQEQLAERNAIVNDLMVQSIEVNSAMTEINRLVSERLNVAINNYNQALASARSFRESIANDISATDTAGLSEGETKAMQDWLSEWEGVDLEEVDVVLGFEGPEVEHGEEIGSLAIEPEVPF
jgi:hypothetical protein